MKKLLLSAVGLLTLGFAGAAAAADLPARTYTKAPSMVAPVYDWSGFYVGGNGGWGTSRKCWDFTDPFGNFIATVGCHNATGGLAGGQFGYRWQSGGVVFGLEAQGDWANLRGSIVSIFPGLADRARIDAFGLFTGQVGYAWNNVLFYVKGGAAVTRDQFDQVTTFDNAVVSRTGDQTRWGGTVGTGIEFGFAPNWSAGLEYDHLFMGNKFTVFTTSATGIFAEADRI